MDSVTQLALGSAIGVAVMGRRTAIWKAAAWGGLCATLPDLDVLVDHGDAIRNMTFHRAESHSLFYLSAASPLLAWLITCIGRESAGFGRWWLATWLVLITHPLLDWLTIYGTQLALPFTDFPFAVGSIFVIDPLYTVCLIVGTSATLLAARRRPGSGHRWNLAGLAVATAYLAWGAGAQAHVTTIAEASLREQSIQADRLLVIPTPFNTVLWRVLAVQGDRYLEGYYSLLDSDRNIGFASYPRGQPLIEQARDNWYVNRIAWFSQGFFRLRREAGVLVISDLRMGQEPSYTFTFSIPEPSQDCRLQNAARTACSADASPGRQPGVPAGKPIQIQQQIDLSPALSWLWRRILGERLPFPAPMRPDDAA